MRHTVLEAVVWSIETHFYSLGHSSFLASVTLPWLTQVSVFCYTIDNGLSLRLLLNILLSCVMAIILFWICRFVFSYAPVVCRSGGYCTGPTHSPVLGWQRRESGSALLLSCPQGQPTYILNNMVSPSALPRLRAEPALLYVATDWA